MQVSSKFTLAIHICTCVDVYEKDNAVTGEFFAERLNMRLASIRIILSQLKAAGIIKVASGTKEVSLAKPLQEITLLDIYRAVEHIGNGDLFLFPEDMGQECPIAKNIHPILDDKLQKVQEAMELELVSVTLEDIKKDAAKYVKEAK